MAVNLRCHSCTGAVGTTISLGETPKGTTLRRVKASKCLRTDEPGQADAYVQVQKSESPLHELLRSRHRPSKHLNTRKYATFSTCKRFLIFIVGVDALQIRRRPHAILARG